MIEDMTVAEIVVTMTTDMMIGMVVTTLTTTMTTMIGGTQTMTTKIGITRDGWEPQVVIYRMCKLIHFQKEHNPLP